MHPASRGEFNEAWQRVILPNCLIVLTRCYFDLTLTVAE